MSFFTEILQYYVEQAMEIWVGIFQSIGNNIFYIENILSIPFSNTIVEDLFNFTKSVAIVFIIIKCLHKGFMTYILWRDGDPDEPLTTMLQNVGLALLAGVGFPVFYDLFAKVSLWMLEQYTREVLKSVDVSGMYLVFTAIMSTSGIAVIMTLIYVIMLFALYIEFLKRGAELLILRIGFPLASLGLLNSDNGVFTAVTKNLIQISLTMMTQLLCMGLSMAIYLTTTPDNLQNILIAIAFAVLAFSIPATLQFILIQSGGGGAIQKVGSVAHTATLVRSLFGKG